MSKNSVVGQGGSMVSGFSVNSDPTVLGYNIFGGDRGNNNSGVSLFQQQANEFQGRADANALAAKRAPTPQQKSTMIALQNQLNQEVQMRGANALSGGAQGYAASPTAGKVLLGNI